MKTLSLLAVSSLMKLPEALLSIIILIDTQLTKALSVSSLSDPMVVISVVGAFLLLVLL